MITQIENIEEIIPLFSTYLEGMSQFYEIRNLDSWCATALKNLQKYAGAEDRRMYILRQSGAIIGFALVNQHLRFNQDGFAIAEFHIQKDHGGKGYGRRLAEHVYAQFPGNWEVALTMKNHNALVFWRQVVSSFTSGKFMEKRNPSGNECGFLFEST